MSTIATNQTFYVTKRDGSHQHVSFDKVTTRMHKLCTDAELGPPLTIDCAEIAQKVVAQIYSGVTTVELDELAAPYGRVHRLHQGSILNMPNLQSALWCRIIIKTHWTPFRKWSINCMHAKPRMAHMLRSFRMSSIIW